MFLTIGAKYFLAPFLDVVCFTIGAKTFLAPFQFGNWG